MRSQAHVDTLRAYSYLPRAPLPELPGPPMAQKRSRKRKTTAPRSRRWLALALGALLFAGAFYVLSSEGDGPPLSEIRPASRAELERVLEQDDRR